MTINILGTKYTIEVKKYKDDEVFERNHFDGYHDGYQKKIVTCDMPTTAHEPKRAPSSPWCRGL